MAAANARGVGQQEALQSLLGGITVKLDGVAGAYIQQCAFDGGKPTLFYEWWSEFSEVIVVFASEGAKQQAVIDVSLRKVDLSIFDGPTEDESVFNLQAWVVRSRNASDECACAPGRECCGRAFRLANAHGGRVVVLRVELI